MILVFGSGGQLGRELLAAAAEAGIEIAGLGHDETDIADPISVKEAIASIRPNLVVNAAAYTNVDKAESEPESAWRANAAGPKIIAEIADRARIPIVHVSTDYVFGGTKTGPYREDDPVAPINIYGQSKAAGETAVCQTTSRHVILRTAWLYSPFGKNFLKTIIRLASERDELRVVADQIGAPTAAGDLAQAILSIAPRLSDADAPFGTYHLTGSGATTWYGFAERILEQQALTTGRRPKVIPISTSDYPVAAQRPKNSVLDCRRFVETFGISLPSWEAAVDRTVTRVFETEAIA